MLGYTLLTKCTQFPRVKIAQQLQQALLHGTDVRHVGQEGVLLRQSLDTTRTAATLPCQTVTST